MGGMSDLPPPEAGGNPSRRETYAASFVGLRVLEGKVDVAAIVQVKLRVLQINNFHLTLARVVRRQYDRAKSTPA